jgi:hypothetical protein
MLVCLTFPKGAFSRMNFLTGKRHKEKIELYLFYFGSDGMSPNNVGSLGMDIIYH